MRENTLLNPFSPKDKGLRWSLYLYLLGACLLFLYSFTQIDLSLTITRTTFFQPLQHFFQYIGYFNRPLSTGLYLFIVILLFTAYLLMLRYSRKSSTAATRLWPVLLLIGVIFLISYNAFSYDFFNYIFDAKIVTHYHSNPYLHKALDYPGDPMLSFMHWTHRTYPYGPSWLVLTVPVSFLGFGVFVPTFFLFKAGIIGAYLGTCYYLQKIAEKIRPGSSFSALVYFAFNPLILIECLVSAHNDIVMLFFAVLALWMLLEKRPVASYLSLLFSIGIKFASGIFLPVFLYMSFRRVSAEKAGKAIGVMVILSLVVILLAAYRTNFQPWYLVLFLGFSAFLTNKKIYIAPVVAFLFYCSFSVRAISFSWELRLAGSDGAFSFVDCAICFLPGTGYRTVLANQIPHQSVDLRKKLGLCS
jgi:hypothetical protein